MFALAESREEDGEVYNSFRKDRLPYPCRAYCCRDLDSKCNKKNIFWSKEPKEQWFIQWIPGKITESLLGLVVAMSKLDLAFLFLFLFSTDEN